MAFARILVAAYLGGFAAVTSAASIRGAGLAPRAIGDFTYVGDTGPLLWWTLDRPATEICATGKNQTPINIEPGSSPGVTTLAPADRPVLDWPTSSGANFENLGSTVQAFVDGTTSFLGDDYTLLQFHFHTPSEHLLSTEHFPLEVHFVHQRTVPLENGERPLAVLGAFFEMVPGTTRPQPIRNVLRRVKEIPNEGDKVRLGRLNFGPIERHFQNFDVYEYSGSLTTPPCSEGVAWGVSAEPFKIDVRTYNEVKDVLKFNSRYIQSDIGQANLLELASDLFCPA